MRELHGLRHARILHDQKGKLLQRGARLIRFGRAGEQIFTDHIGSREAPDDQFLHERIETAVGAHAHRAHATKIG